MGDIKLSENVGVKSPLGRGAGVLPALNIGKDCKTYSDIFYGWPLNISVSGTV